MSVAALVLRRRSSLLRCLVLLAIVLAWPRRAAAQLPPTGGDIPNVTLSTPQPDRTPVVAGRPTALVNTQISKADCLADVVLTFHLTLSGPYPSDAQLEAWAGQGNPCTDPASRNGTTSVCWPLFTKVAPAQTISIPIHVRDIAEQFFDNPKQPTLVSGNEATCNHPPYATAGGDDAGATTSGDGGVTTSSGPQSVTINFLWISGTNATTAQSQDVQFDFWGPDPPTNVKASNGDRVVTVSWTPLSSAGTEILGYTVFCGPVDTSDAGVSSAADDASTICCYDGGRADGGWDGGYDDAGNPVDDAGNIVDITVPVDGGCVPHTGPCTSSGGGAGNGSCPAPPSNVCAQPGGGQTSGTTINGDDIVNGKTYSVAVGATDQFGNVGTLSSPDCATPGPVLDFFKRYRDDGGGAGGCALESRGAPVGLGVLAWGASIVGFAIVRRRRRSRS